MNPEHGNVADESSASLAPDQRCRWTRVGMLAALAIILGYLETFVPIPIPGVKLGLANIAVLVALAQDDAAGALGIAAIKVLASGLLFGSPIMMVYSATGTLLAFVIMAPLSRLRTMHLVMVSVVGAMAHELGQLCVAMALLGTPLVWYSSPVLLVAGCVTGTLCGMVAHRAVALIRSSEPSVQGNKRGQCSKDEKEAGMGSRVPVELPRRGPSAGFVRVSGRVALVAYLVFCVATLRASSAPVLGGAIACSVVACLFGRVRARSMLLALRPLVFILLVTLVAQVLNAQYGQVLVRIGTINVTAQAVVATATMTARLLALTAASLAVMHLASLDGLVEAIDWLIGPLGRLGLRTDGFMLALKTALEFVPLLAAAIEQNSARIRGSLGTRELWTTVFPGIIAQLYRQAG